MPGREISWLPQEALDRMHSDLMVHADLTRAALAERIVEDAAPLAAYTVVELATTSQDERIRLDASKYLLDRANGKPKTSVQLNLTETNPVLQILEGVVIEHPADDEYSSSIPAEPTTSPFAPPIPAETVESAGPTGNDTEPHTNVPTTDMDPPQ